MQSLANCRAITFEDALKQPLSFIPTESSATLLDLISTQCLMRATA